MECRPRSSSGMQLFQRGVHRLCQLREIARGLGVAEETHPHLAVVAEQGNSQRLMCRERHLGKAVQHPLSQHEEGELRPGTLVTNRVNNPQTACRRAAWARSWGGAKSPRRESVCAPTAAPLFFTTIISSCSFRSRSTGSGSVRGSGQKTADTWLP